MSAVDHTAEAQKHYEAAIEANQNGKWETTRFEMQLAKFHTESAAVEQQKRIANELRTANLLAAYSPRPYDDAAYPLIETLPNDVANDIAERLGRER